MLSYSGVFSVEVRVTDVFNASAEIAAAGDYPGLRMWTAADTISFSEVNDIPDVQSSLPAGSNLGPYSASSWSVSGPASFPKAATTPHEDWFSAVCYFAGRDIYTSQRGLVPIGLMATDWGGQPIEPFMSPDALADKTCGGTRNISAGVEVESKPSFATPQEAEQVGSTSGSSVLWWGMIEPLAKMRITGSSVTLTASAAQLSRAVCYRFPLVSGRDKLQLSIPI